MSIGQRLLHERIANNWKQRTLADKIGTTELQINRWERDKYTPSPYYQAKLCEVFGKTPDELFGLYQDKEPTLIWNVPHRRNPFFTGREEILTRLHNKFSLNKTIALSQPHAISGLGGIGKTQIAIEYAYRYGHEYKAVLWVLADLQESLISELANLAPVLNLSEKRPKNQSKAVEAVLRWLQNNTDWLLILDNADEIRMALEFLPTQTTGYILLTTRSQPKGNKIIGIEIDKMRREEGVLFLLRRGKFIAEVAPIESASDAQRQDADTLYDLLDGLPLAIDQAGAFIEETSCSLQEYLELFETHQEEFLQRRGEFGETDHPEPVATTWSLNFERVEQNNPAAADLLRLCAFLYPDDISEQMIVSGAAELGSILQDVVVDPKQLLEAIGELVKYSLVRRNPETKTMTIHRLVHAVFKESMNEGFHPDFSVHVR